MDLTFVFFHQLSVVLVSTVHIATLKDGGLHTSRQHLLGNFDDKGVHHICSAYSGGRGGLVSQSLNRDAGIAQLRAVVQHDLTVFHHHGAGGVQRGYIFRKIFAHDADNVDAFFLCLHCHFNHNGNGYTGYSVWLAYLTAIVMGFFMVFPYIILGGTMRVAGGPYSIVTNLSGVSTGGLVAYTKLVTPILNSSFALALGLYLNNLLPGITVKALAIAGVVILFVLNLLGMDIFAKVSKILSTVLLITMVLYVVFGLTQIRQPIFNFSGDKMFTGGFKGFMLAALLLINSANGYYNVLWYGKDAKRATKDVPFAAMSCVPCLLFIYVGLAMVTGGVLPHDEVAGVETILPAAQEILPGIVYKLFMIGGPIMAIITTLNGVFNDVRYPIAQAAKDGWLPKGILKENRFGAPYLIYTYTLIVVLLPIIFDMSIVTITNIFQVITFFMNVTVVYAISRLPKKYPDTWKKNKFHLSSAGLYVFCTISIIIYTIIFIKGIFSIKLVYAVSAVIVMVALILIGVYLTRKGGIRIETSIWQPAEEEKNE